MKPILNQLGDVFIPVSNIEQARDWYCDILGVPSEGEIYFGHLFVVPMKGSQIVLDSKIYKPDFVYNVPAFQLRTENIHEAYEYLKEKNVHLETDIENGHWFNFRDPDGNLLMVCQ